MGTTASPAQGMMLSERPSFPSHSTMGGDGGPSIGNYKGVMLCNRPFAGAAAVAQHQESGCSAGSSAFVTGTVKSQLGFCGASSKKKDAIALRKKGAPPPKETALGRHRKWLADLQRTKDALEAAYLVQVAEKEAKKKRFMEREALIRREKWAAARRGPAGEAKGGDEAAAGDGAAQSEGGDSELTESLFTLQDWEAMAKKVEEEIEVGSGPATAESKISEGSEGGRRPMWALTEKKAEEQEDEELQALLNFTKGLDFDKYIQDSEVQAMIDQVRSRIEALERAEAKGVGGGQMEQQGGEGAGGDEASMAEKIARLTDANLRCIAESSKECHGGNQDNDDDAMSVARSMLSEGGASVKSVHSAKSLAAIADRAKTNILATQQQRMQSAPETVGGRDALREESTASPRIVLLKEDGGTRLNGKSTVSNLPYLHRNPAI